MGTCPGTVKMTVSLMRLPNRHVSLAAYYLHGGVKHNIRVSVLVFLFLGFDQDSQSCPSKLIFLSLMSSVFLCLIMFCA